MSTDFTTMKTAELVEFYNKNAAKPIKNFKDKKTAIARCKALKTVAKKAAKKTVSKSEGKGGRSREAMDFPYVGKEHQVRDGSLRASLITAMQKGDNGATEAALCKVVEAHDVEQNQDSDPETAVSRVRQTLRILHSYNGYGIIEKDGRYKLRTR